MIKIDQLIRSNRRTIGLQITNDARLIVRAPFYTSEAHILRLLQRKESWINEKQDFFIKRLKKVSIKKFIPGEEFLLLGKNYPLIVNEDLPKAVVLENESLMVSPMVLGNLRDHLEKWYKQHALEYFTQRVNEYCSLTGLKYSSIKVNEATTRWGSCGYKDTLNFTWRLIMAPPRVIDYVVVHELMHVKQKNHSCKFWSEVRKVIWDYKQDERWLKENSHDLKWS